MWSEVRKSIWRPLNRKYIISAIRLDINAVSTAVPMFSGSAIPSVLTEIMRHAARSQKSNMAALKPEVHLSQLKDQISVRFQRLFRKEDEVADILKATGKKNASSWNAQKPCNTGQFGGKPWIWKALFCNGRTRTTIIYLVITLKKYIDVQLHKNSHSTKNMDMGPICSFNLWCRSSCSRQA